MYDKQHIAVLYTQSDKPIYPHIDNVTWVYVDCSGGCGRAALDLSGLQLSGVITHNYNVSDIDVNYAISKVRVPVRHRQPYLI